MSCTFYGINAVVRLFHRFLRYDMAGITAFIRMLKQLFFPLPETTNLCKLRRQLHKLRKKVPERANAWGMYMGDTVKKACALVSCSARRTQTRKELKISRKSFKALPQKDKLVWRARAESRAQKRRQDLLRGISLVIYALDTRCQVHVVLSKSSWRT